MSLVLRHWAAIYVRTPVTGAATKAGVQNFDVFAVPDILNHSALKSEFSSFPVTFATHAEMETPVHDRYFDMILDSTGCWGTISSGV